jgi:hypothetical protein
MHKFSCNVGLNVCFMLSTPIHSAILTVLEIFTVTNDYICTNPTILDSDSSSLVHPAMSTVHQTVST